MNHVVVAAVVGVLVLERVQAVRAGRDDALGPLSERLVEHLDVAGCQFKEQRLVARSPGRVAGAAFQLAQHGKVDAGGVENFGKIARRLLRARIGGGRAAHPPQNIRLRVLLDGRHVEALAQSSRDSGARFHGLPWRSMPLKACLSCVGKGVLHQHLVAADVEDVAHRLVVDRADLDARAAGGAGPHRFGADGKVEQADLAILVRRRVSRLRR